MKPRLLITNQYDIKEISIHGSFNRTVVSNHTNAVGLDFHWDQDCIYWSDVAKKSSSIRRKCGKGDVEVGSVL